jgi:hypothetical protein
MEVFPMKKMSWILSALAMAALVRPGTSTAQEPKAMPAAPATTASTPPVYLGNGCCGTAGCDTGCCNSCCDRRGGVIADVGFMILTPKFSENQAFVHARSDDAANQTLPFEAHQQDFSYHAQFVPQISLGYIGCNGFGFRVNWWSFAMGTKEIGVSDANNEFIAASPLQIQELQDLTVEAEEGSGDTLFATTALRMHVWDFEAVAEFGCCPWSFLASAGVRYAHISQDYNAAVITATGATNTFILSGQNFNGAGPTISLEARRALGNSGLYLYSKGRGSVLFGTSKQSATIGTGTAGAEFFASSRSNSVLPEGELELGAGFRRHTCRGDIFLEAGVVGQVWCNVGSAAESSGNANFDIGPGEDASASVNRNSTLGLIGFTLRTGLNW